MKAKNLILGVILVLFLASNLVGAQALLEQDQFDLRVEDNVLVVEFLMINGVGEAVDDVFVDVIVDGGNFVFGDSCLRYL